MNEDTNETGDEPREPSPLDEIAAQTAGSQAEQSALQYARHNLHKGLLLGDERRWLRSEVRGSSAYPVARKIARIFNVLAGVMTVLAVAALLVGLVASMLNATNSLFGVVCALGAALNALFLIAFAKVLQMLADLGDVNLEILNDHLASRAAGGHLL